jgi:hypothetical protein
MSNEKPPIAGADGGRFERYSASSFADRGPSHVIRTRLIEQCVALEFSINEVLAARLSWDLRAADELTMQVFTRLSVDARIAMLDDAMTDTGADELWPLLVPTLKIVFNLRNRYAHGFVSMKKDGSVEITTWNRGRGTVARYDIETLAWLSWQAMVCSLELTRMWAYFAPAEPRWHGDFALE